MSVQAAEAQDITEAEATTTDAAVTETKTEDSAAVETKTETKADLNKPTVEKPKEEIKYALKLPDGSLLEKSRVEEIVSIAKERGLSNADAQKLLEVEHGAVNSFMNRAKTKQNTETQQWVEGLKKDPEIGGEQFNQSIALARDALDKFFDPGLKPILDETGYGNHPLLVKGLVKIGKAMQSDKIVRSNSTVGGNVEKSIEERLYPAMFRDKGE